MGLLGAARFSAYVQTPHRFSSKRKLWRYGQPGIPDRSSDGKPPGFQALDWNDKGRLKDVARKAFHASLKKCRRDNLFKRFYYAGLQRTHDADPARLSTMRKILAVMRAVWISQGASTTRGVTVRSNFRTTAGRG